MITMDDKARAGAQAMTVEILEPEEEATLRFIKENWEKNQPKKISIKELTEKFLTKELGYDSQEKARQLVYALFRKGQVLIDVKGKERLIRPNHVTIYPRMEVLDFRNFTIIDPETEFPTARIWCSISKDSKGERFLNITESKRSPQGWETANNVVIPPESFDEFGEMMTYIIKKLKDLR